jgi:predicted 3-demethylubiquinone-9 3-methyltransferase (glyoxalase superfamily)
MQKVAPCLWFDGKAEEAARFYTSLFPLSRITGISRYGEAGPGPKGKVMTVQFRLAGQDFIALNGGPQYRFTPAISLSVDCRSQREVDRLWEKLTKGGGAPVQCGWLTDRFGVSWQIVPSVLRELLSDPDPERTKRVMQAMLQMVKLDVEGLRQAAGPRGRRRLRARARAVPQRRRQR